MSGDATLWNSDMRVRFLILGTVSVLLVSVPGTQAQSDDAARFQVKTLDPALLAKGAGDAEAEFQLASRLMNGIGVPQNTKEAMIEYNKAAEKGKVEAQYMLGQIYEDGGLGKAVRGPDGSYREGSGADFHAVPQDFGLAAKWYRRAAEQDLPLAQNGLGRLYAAGSGVPQDYAEAYFWLSLASASGHHSATNGVDDRDLAASHLTKTVLLETQQRASKWFAAHQPKSQ
jgi:TPR repeat protein